MKVSRQLAATLCLAMVLFSGGCSVYQSQRMEPGSGARYSGLWGVAGERWSEASRLPDFSAAGYRSGGRELPRPPVVASVRDFGATGDGTTDDTAAFEAALAAVDAGAVLVPRGNYRISRPLSIRRPGVVLRGEDANASVIMAAPIHGDCSVPNQGPPNCAPYQGAAMLEIEGTVGGNRLATVVVAASRGERRLRLSSVAGIRAGQWIRLTMRNPADNSLGCHLYLERGCLNPERRQWYSGRIVDWLVRVESVAGDTVTLERALRLDVRMGWSPEIRSFSASVEDSGIENLSLRFSGEAYAGHNNEQGHYGILIRDAYNCWVRDVTIIDADRGVDIRGGYNTISGLQLRAALRTPQLTAKVFATGHYGVSVAGPRSQDNLIENSVVQTVFVHNLSVASFANGNVFSGIRSAVPHFDHHGAGAYENLYTEISLADSGQDLFLSGGRRPDEPGGARTTLWNVVFPGSASLGRLPQDLPGLTLVGVDGMAAYRADPTMPDWWVESWPGAETMPPNIYRAQRALREQRDGTGRR